MKWLGNLLIVLSLTGGALSAATAYLAPLSLPDAELTGLTLNADAGLRPGPGPRAPLYKKSTGPGEATRVTADMLAALRDGGVRYLHVKEFSLARWPGKWYFALSVGGLLAGAYLVRAATRRDIERGGGLAAGAPAQALEGVREGLHSLRQEIGAWDAPEQARLLTVLERVGQLQRTHVQAFVDARTLLVGRMGLGGYAEVMDRFAACERQLNRAWSAAADQVYAEAVDSLAAAAGLIDEAIDRFRRRWPAAG